jgi:hypothetical protein
MATGVAARLLLLAACVSLGGCVAALVPIAAAGVIGKERLDGRKSPKPAFAGREVAALSAVPGPVPLVPPTSAAVPVLVQPPSAAPAASHGWRDVVPYVARRLQPGSRPVESVVLAPAATPASPAFLPCGTKSFAVIVDADGTILPSAASRQAAESLEALRTMGVTVIFLSNRPLAEGLAIENALDRAGFGPAMQGRTLLLQGEDATGPKKDGRRVGVARLYCVLALVGDEPGDFADGLAPGWLPDGLASRWGAGWFRLPAPANDDIATVSGASGVRP